MVEFLKYGDEKLPVKVSFAALKNFQKESNKNMMDVDSELTFEDIEILFFHSYVAGCKASKNIGFSVKYSREDMEEILDEIYMDFVKVMPKFFAKKK